MSRQYMPKPRIIIMRHSERLDFILQSSQWPHDVFVNGIYSPNVTEMPTELPMRADPLEYAFDTPLSRHGVARAYHTGEHLRARGVVPTRVYTSPAMRCVQTADSVLRGLRRSDRVPLRIDLALHEPTKRHLPLQTASLFASSGFFVDRSYHPVLSPSNPEQIVRENRAEYYRRLFAVMKMIVSRLVSQNDRMSHSSTPPTAIIVTHRPCVTLLAAMLNLRSVDDKIAYLSEIEGNNSEQVEFLAMIIAEFDITTGLWTYLVDYPSMVTNPYPGAMRLMH